MAVHVSEPDVVREERLQHRERDKRQSHGHAGEERQGPTEPHDGGRRHVPDGARRGDHASRRDRLVERHLGQVRLRHAVRGSEFGEDPLERHALVRHRVGRPRARGGAIRSRERIVVTSARRNVRSDRSSTKGSPLTRAAPVSLSVMAGLRAPPQAGGRAFPKTLPTGPSCPRAACARAWSADSNFRGCTSSARHSAFRTPSRLRRARIG